jgi:uncharacterized protein (TIGR02231 family)
VFTPLRIGAAEPDGRAGQGGPVGQNSEQVARLIEQLRQQRRHIGSSHGDGLRESLEERDVALNTLAGRIQQIELLSEASTLRNIAQDGKDDAASETYRLPQTVSLDSLREPQFVEILQSDLQGKMYHVAAPLLSSFAFREVELTNTGSSLPAGPAAVYLDDRFVGRTHIPPTAAGQLLFIGFGADPQVRTRRELRDKQDEIQGGNRKLTFEYRLVAANFKTEPLTLRLKDRLPTTRQDKTLAIQLEEPEQKLSADGLYMRVERPQGILRWDLEVPADRHGSRAFDVHYRFTAEFDRTKTIDAQDLRQEMEAEYQKAIPGGGGMGGFGGGGGIF